MPGDALLRYTVPMPDDSLILGRAAEKVALNGSVLPTLPDGGPGRYSSWLAGVGHRVHPVDPVEKHVRQTREASESQPRHPLASVTRGDARSLNHGDGIGLPPVSVPPAMFSPTSTGTGSAVMWVSGHRCTL